MSTLVGLTAVANAQSLGSAANYDLLLLQNGQATLKEGNLGGAVGFGYNSKVGLDKDVYISGDIFVHSRIGEFKADDDYAQVSGNTYFSGYDTQLDKAHEDAVTFANKVSASDYSVTAAFGNFKSDDKGAFSFSSSMSQTVLDFGGLEMKGSNFTLNGRAGQNDRFIIRISDQLKFENSNVVLNNLNRDNVIWVKSGDKNFDLHKNNYGEFSGTIVALDGQVILGEVDFAGSVIGSDLKLGSGFVLSGTSIPEPSSSLLLLSGLSGLMLVRRRQS
ncbi:MAG: collagen-binding domain-containing protein [Verrucomicrobiaceae bacterium]